MRKLSLPNRNHNNGDGQRKSASASADHAASHTVPDAQVSAQRDTVETLEAELLALRTDLLALMYLVDPQTAEEFTFSTSSLGGREINLAGQIKRVRGKHPDAVPLVELGAAPMKTKFGRKSKPVLKVVDWLNMAPAVVIEQPGRRLPPPAAANDLNDDIPF